MLIDNRKTRKKWTFCTSNELRLSLSLQGGESLRPRKCSFPYRIYSKKTHYYRWIYHNNFLGLLFLGWRESAVKMFLYVYFTYLKKSFQAHKLHSTSACMVSTLLFARLILNQCRLTRHGKNWSSLFPMPKQPLTFFPQTKSSPRSAKQPSNMSRLRGRAPAEPQHRAAAVCFTGMRHNNNQKSS